MKAMARPIEAAGGIVLRGQAEPRFAIAQRRKDRAWVLPKGKLNRGERAIDGARREAIEETGHEVIVHEFLGAISYDTSKAPKVVQFWRMEALDTPQHPLMKDIRAVEWLPLKDAVKRLSLPREKAFLRSVGPQARTMALITGPAKPVVIVPAPPAAEPLAAPALAERRQDSDRRWMMRLALAALYVVAGIAHVIAPGGFVAITPSWVPFPAQVIFLTGLFELCASAALFVPRLRWYAGVVLAAYALAVWPANIHHAFAHIVVPPIPDSWWYHGPRLALQPVIIWWALYATHVIDWPWRTRKDQP